MTQSGYIESELALAVDYSELEGTGKGVIWKDGEYHGNIFKETETEMIYTAVLTDIMTQNLDKNYAFRAYCIAETEAGVKTVIYSDISEISIYDVALLIIADPENGLTEDELGYIQK